MAFEIIGDKQLQNFRDDPNKIPGKVIETGLWRITRHPNYFGECFLWWGIWLIACGGSVGPKGGYWCFFAPLYITCLIRFFSGVVILESSQKRKPAFRVYMEETNVFIPWFYKSIQGEEREKLLAQAKIDIAEDAIKMEGYMMNGLYKKSWSWWEKGDKAPAADHKVNSELEIPPQDNEKNETKA